LQRGIWRLTTCPAQTPLSPRGADAFNAPPPGAPGPPLQFILLVEPSFSRLTDLLQGLDFAYPSADSAKVGALAASQQLVGGNAAPRTLLASLARDILPGAHASGAHASGAVGLTLVGDVA
jgi:small ligand-binding sensory domain FIST